jgi:hypothetical protein
MSILKKSLITVLLGCLSLTVVSCDQKGPAEKVGETIDKGIEKTGDAIEEAGEAVEDAAKDANKKIKDAKQ